MYYYFCGWKIESHKKKIEYVFLNSHYNVFIGKFLSFSHIHIIKIETSGTHLTLRNGNVPSLRGLVVIALQIRILRHQSKINTLWKEDYGSSWAINHKSSKKDLCSHWRVFCFELIVRRGFTTYGCQQSPSHLTVIVSEHWYLQINVKHYLTSFDKTNFCINICIKILLTNGSESFFCSKEGTNTTMVTHESAKCLL